MIGRKSSRKPEDVSDEGPRGFDDFALRLGDVMRGERATMGKSLLDVQRELRIKASYIAAIENSDPSAFDNKSFTPTTDFRHIRIMEVQEHRQGRTARRTA